MNWIDEIRIFEIILPSLKNKLQARDKEIDRLTAELSFTKQELGAANVEIKRLKKLQEAFNRFGTHRVNCDSHTNLTGKCDCGFDEALKVT